MSGTPGEYVETITYSHCFALLLLQRCEMFTRAKKRELFLYYKWKEDCRARKESNDRRGVGGISPCLLTYRMRTWVG